jgi:hypothetical protein
MAIRGHYDNDKYMWAIIIRRFCDRIGSTWRGEKGFLVYSKLCDGPWFGILH